MPAERQPVVDRALPAEGKGREEHKQVEMGRLYFVNLVEDRHLEVVEIPASKVVPAQVYHRTGPVQPVAVCKALQLRCVVRT